MTTQVSVEGNRNLHHRHHRHWLLLIIVWLSFISHFSMYAPYMCIIPKGLGLTMPWHSVQKTVDGNAGVALDWTWHMKFIEIPCQLVKKSTSPNVLYSKPGNYEKIWPNHTNPTDSCSFPVNHLSNPPSNPCSNRGFQAFHYFKTTRVFLQLADFSEVLDYNEIHQALGRCPSHWPPRRVEVVVSNLLVLWIFSVAIFLRYPSKAKKMKEIGTPWQRWCWCWAPPTTVSRNAGTKSWGLGINCLMWMVRIS